MMRNTKITANYCKTLQIPLCFFPKYQNFAKRFNRTLPLDLRYHHGYQVRRIGSEAHRWSIENEQRLVWQNTSN